MKAVMDRYGALHIEIGDKILTSCRSKTSTTSSSEAPNRIVLEHLPMRHMSDLRDP